MIYTVTVSPSLDMFVGVSDLKKNSVNRTECADYRMGGKGLNVSLVLKRFGIDSVALGFYGGFTGRELLRLAEAEGLSLDMTEVCENTRINVKCVSNCGVTELNSAPQAVTEAERNALILSLGGVTEGDIAVLSGSDPYLLYPELVAKLKSRGAYVIVDTSGASLSDCIEMRPDLIKPNIDELKEHFKVDINADNCDEYIRTLAEKGIAVLLTVGEKGAVFADGRGVKRYPTPKSIKAVNTVGAGDSAVAGYIYGLHYGIDPCLSAVAAGTASAAAYGFCTLSDMLEMMEV